MEAITAPAGLSAKFSNGAPASDLHLPVVAFGGSGDPLVVNGDGRVETLAKARARIEADTLGREFVGVKSALHALWGIRDALWEATP